MGANQWTEDAYRDLAPQDANSDSPARSGFRPNVWPPPAHLPDGRVWISDFEDDPELDLWEAYSLSSGRLTQVRRFQGIGLRAHWFRYLEDGLESSPTLLFSRLSDAVAWGRSLTDRIVVQLLNSEPWGQFRLGDLPSRLPAAPPDLIEDWDARYGT